jgi:NAD(P)-dependent dehydrogenase (short-subunit alcohol dehydrogenase family)
MELGLKSKVVIVTEATTGIGEAVARGFAEEGALLAIGGSNAAALEKGRAGLAAGGAEVLAVRADPGEPGDMRRLVDETLARFGRIDIVVSNAGAELGGSIDDVPTDALADLVRSKLLGPWELARAVGGHMRARGSGRIVVVISDAGKIPSRATIASGVAGAAQHAFVKSLSDDLGRSNVLVTGVSVGHIGPPSANGGLVRDLYVSRSLEQQESGWAADVPLGRWGKPEDVANAVLFLSSDCSSFVCGSNLDVDGGDQRTIF